MPKYEVTAPGFDGNTDRTDDLVFWISSVLPVDELVKNLREDNVLGKEFDLAALPDDADTDFDYPAQRNELKDEAACRCFRHIANLLSVRHVEEFNLSKEPTVVVEGCMIVVRRHDYPEYYFNENGALEAVFGHNELTMPDAQGFTCTFKLSPRILALLLPTQEDQVAFATGRSPENIVSRIFDSAAELSAYRDGLDALEDENDEIIQIDVNGGTVHLSSTSRDNEEGDTIEFATDNEALAYQQGVEDSNGFKKPVIYTAEDAEFDKLQAFFAAKQPNVQACG